MSVGGPVVLKAAGDGAPGVVFEMQGTIWGAQRCDILVQGTDFGALRCDILEQGTDFGALRRYIYMQDTDY